MGMFNNNNPKSTQYRTIISSNQKRSLETNTEQVLQAPTQKYGEFCSEHKFRFEKSDKVLHQKVQNYCKITKNIIIKLQVYSKTWMATTKNKKLAPKDQLSPLIMLEKQLKT